jgi:hypothetical protein
MNALIRNIKSTDARVCCAAVLFFGIAINANADTLSEVVAALEKFSNSQAIFADMEIKSRTIRGGGDDRELNETQFDVTVTADNKGVSVHFGENILSELERELNAKSTDPNQLTPTIEGTRDINIADIHSMLTASRGLLRRLARGVLINEEASHYKHQAATLLTFQLPKSLTDRETKYVKKYTGIFRLWVNQDNIPIASEIDITIQGRIFLVISFSYEQYTLEEYTLQGDRLIATHKQFSDSSSGGGEKGQSFSEKNLALKEPLHCRHRDCP